MSVLIACGYCNRVFLPRDREGFCPDCLPGYTRLQAECACRVNPEESLGAALGRLRGYVGRRDLLLQNPADQE